MKASEAAFREYPAFRLILGKDKGVLFGGKFPPERIFFCKNRSVAAPRKKRGDFGSSNIQQGVKKWLKKGKIWQKKKLMLS